jgi:hypothetical protein
MPLGINLQSWGDLTDLTALPPATYCQVADVHFHEADYCSLLTDIESLNKSVVYVLTA